MKLPHAATFVLAPLLHVAVATSLLAACASDGATHAQSAHAPTAVRFEPWSDEAFARAKREHKLVLLDLQAVWCHWCHVMEETTYRDPEVTATLADHFVTIQVDQDARPDISIRYEDYGWPATIVFDADGRELVKRAGYIPPADMTRLLRAVVDDPTPGPSAQPAAKIEFATTSVLAKPVRQELEKQVTSRYDAKLGGYGFVHKYVDAPSLGWLVMRALEGDARCERMAKQTLDAALVLVDPAWGGVYQYSAGGVWSEPHFEKIMAVQCDDLRIYSLAYSAWKDPTYLKAAQSIRAYLHTFLASPDGAFYTSQDADLVPGEHAGEYFALDDAARRARGIPRIDTHVYARENGWVCRALCAFAATTGDESAIADARRAVEWIVGHRAIEGGGFRHDERDVAGPYLGDTLAMGQAFLALYETTGERSWLQRAIESNAFIARNFAPSSGSLSSSSDASSPSNEFVGFRTSVNRSAASTVNSAASSTTSSALPQRGVVQRGENIELARFENELHHYTGSAKAQQMRDEALRFLATREIALDGLPGGVLLAFHEAENDPQHVTIVGSKHDATAKSLFQAALALPLTYRRIEWFDAHEGPLENDDVPFPDMPKSAAFVCANGRCTSPAYEPAAIADRLQSTRAKR